MKLWHSIQIPIAARIRTIDQFFWCRDNVGNMNILLHREMHVPPSVVGRNAVDLKMLGARDHEGQTDRSKPKDRSHFVEPSTEATSIN